MSDHTSENGFGFTTSCPPTEPEITLKVEQLKKLTDYALIKESFGLQTTILPFLKILLLVLFFTFKNIF